MSRAALIAEHVSRSFVGRRHELALLEQLGSQEACVVHVHGVAGIGKSALVAAFLERMRAECAETLMLDCRSVEPTERGLLDRCSKENHRRVVLCSSARWSTLDCGKRSSGRCMAPGDEFSGRQPSHRL